MNSQPALACGHIIVERNRGDRQKRAIGLFLCWRGRRETSTQRLGVLGQAARDDQWIEPCLVSGPRIAQPTAQQSCFQSRCIAAGNGIGVKCALRAAKMYNFIRGQQGQIFKGAADMPAIDVASQEGFAALSDCGGKAFEMITQFRRFGSECGRIIQCNDEGIIRRGRKASMSIYARAAYGVEVETGNQVIAATDDERVLRIKAKICHA